MLKIGSVIDGKYKILNIVGKGGMSTVYLAMNEKANKQWAIKEITGKDYCDFELDKKEIELMKHLKHPSLPTIVDVIERQGALLIVMDYIEGLSLEDIVLEYGPQNENIVIEWAKQLCDVMHYLHTQDPPIIYRDMKPANVILKPDGKLVLIDFGAAREYHPKNMKDTVLLGTRGYAAPEQYRTDGQSDARTDIYSLGVTIFRLLTGEGPDELCPVRQLRPEVSAGIEQILQKCVRKLKQERYQTAPELLEALNHYWEYEEKFQREQRKKLCLFLLPFFLCVALAAGSVTFSVMEKIIRTHNYQEYLTAAGNAEMKGEKTENYKKAIQLDPKKEDAYLLLLEKAFLEDSLMSLKESETMRDILAVHGQNFLKNESGYAKFCYEMGIAYFYKYEDKSNKKSAREYLENAKTAQMLPEQKKMRAERLFLISDYYHKIGIVDEAGDVQVSYLDYWNDLIRVSHGNLVEEDNARTAVVMYGELLSQIMTKTAEFKDDGVKKEELEEQLCNIEQHLQEDFFSISESMRSSVEEDIFYLKEMTDKAKKMVASVYNSVE